MFRQFSARVFAQSISPVLTFSGFTTADYFTLDDVALGVQEPTTLPLIAAGVHPIARKRVAGKDGSSRYFGDLS